MPVVEHEDLQNTYRDRTVTTSMTNVNVGNGQNRPTLPLIWRNTPNGVLTSGFESAAIISTV
jgi:hypothetical protein